MIDYSFIKGSKAKGFLFGGFRSLWLTDDHILLVQNNIFNENYRRFYFQDIQAFTIVESKRRLWIAVANCIILVLFLLSAFATDEEAIRWTTLLLSVAPLLFLAMNWLKGETSCCYIQTNVQNVQLPMVRRRTTEKIIEELSPVILQDQASLIPKRKQHQFDKTEFEKNNAVQ